MKIVHLFECVKRMCTLNFYQIPNGCLDTFHIKAESHNTIIQDNCVMIHMCCLINLKNKHSDRAWQKEMMTREGEGMTELKRERAAN